jgi:hypothetical protein
MSMGKAPKNLRSIAAATLLLLVAGTAEADEASENWPHGSVRLVFGGWLRTADLMGESDARVALEGEGWLSRYVGVGGLVQIAGYAPGGGALGGLIPSEPGWSEEAAAPALLFRTGDGTFRFMVRFGLGGAHVTRDAFKENPRVDTFTPFFSAATGVIATFEDVSTSLMVQYDRYGPAPAAPTVALGLGLAIPQTR